MQQKLSLYPNQPMVRLLEAVKGVARLFPSEEVCHIA